MQSLLKINERAYGRGESGIIESPDFGRGESGIIESPDFGRGESGIIESPDFGRGESGIIESPDFGRGESGIIESPDLLPNPVPAYEIAIFVATISAIVMRMERARFRLRLRTVEFDMRNSPIFIK